MTAMPTFRDFLVGPGGRLIQQVLVDISDCKTWQDYEMRLHNLDSKKLADAVTSGVRDVSIEECAVLAAALTAANLPAISDELYDDQDVEPWDALSRVSGPYRDAVIACLARID